LVKKGRAKRPGRHNTPAYDRLYYQNYKKMLNRNRVLRRRAKRLGLTVDQAALQGR